MVAFRNVVPTIPLDTAVDELSIQALVTQLGYRLVYEPQAAVYNRGPATVQDFLRQRRRIHAGHLKIRNRQAYAAPTMSAWRAGHAMLEPELFASPRTVLWSLGTIGLEAYARALGRYDIIRGHRTHTVWEMVDSTKDQIDDAAAHRQHVVVIFHIANFHLIELDLGVHTARQLARRVADRIQQILGSSVRVSAQEAGTTIAVLSGDRAAAEEAAGAVVRHFAQAPVQVGGKGTATPVTLACGIVSFPQPGPQPGQIQSAAVPIPRIEQVESTPATPATT
jgi:GGDEF domain-containing protein